MGKSEMIELLRNEMEENNEKIEELECEISSLHDLNVETAYQIFKIESNGFKPLDTPNFSNLIKLCEEFVNVCISNREGYDDYENNEAIDLWLKEEISQWNLFDEIMQAFYGEFYDDVLRNR